MYRYIFCSGDHLLIALHPQAASTMNRNANCESPIRWSETRVKRSSFYKNEMLKQNFTNRIRRPSTVEEFDPTFNNITLKTWAERHCQLSRNDSEETEMVFYDGL